MNRRNFLTAAGAAIAGLTLAGPLSAVLPLPKKYVLYGDGDHDDTEALNAWVRGETVQWPDGRIIPSDRLEAYGKTFLLSGSIVIDDADRHLSFYGGVYEAGPNFPKDAAMFDAKHHGTLELNNVDWRMRPSAYRYGFDTYESPYLPGWTQINGDTFYKPFTA